MDLVRHGGYAAWTIGDWFVMKYANVAIYLLIAVLFIAGMLIDLPGRGDQHE